MPFDSPPPLPPLPPPSDQPRDQPPSGTGPFAVQQPPEPGPPGYGWGARGFYPLDFDRITRTGASLFRYAWRGLIGAALVPYAIAYLIMAPIAASVSPVFNDWVVRYQAAVENRIEPPPFPAGQEGGVLLLFAAGIGALLAGIVATAAAIHITDAAFRGRPTSVRGALGAALRRTPAMIGQQLLLFLAVFGIMLLAFVFGAFFFVGGSAAAFVGLLVIVAAFTAAAFIAIRWTLGPQTVVLEGIGAVEGLSRSWRLVAGSGWRVLGYVIFFGLIGLGAALLTGLAQALLNLDPSRPLDVALGTLLDGAATLILAPIVPLLGTLLYYDLRHRAGEPAPQPGEANGAARETA